MYFKDLDYKLIQYYPLQQILYSSIVNRPNKRVQLIPRHYIYRNITACNKLHKSLFYSQLINSCLKDAFLFKIIAFLPYSLLSKYAFNYIGGPNVFYLRFYKLDLVVRYKVLIDLIYQYIFIYILFIILDLILILIINQLTIIRLTSFILELSML